MTVLHYWLLLGDGDSTGHYGADTILDITTQVRGEGAHQNNTRKIFLFAPVTDIA